MAINVCYVCRVLGECMCGTSRYFTFLFTSNELLHAHLFLIARFDFQMFK